MGVDDHRDQELTILSKALYKLLSFMVVIPTFINNLFLSRG